MTRLLFEELTCPRCGHRGSYRIDVTATAFVDAGGSYVEGGDYHWDARSRCTCLGCGHEAPAGDFVAKAVSP
jgi:transcription elongation factor Elf1